MKHLDLITNKFQQFTQEYFNKQPYNLYEPIRYAMGTKGKYIRPQLMIYAAELFGGGASEVLLNSYGLELFHNFTLVHDDIMDNSPIRRGKETVYKKFGLNTGILSGDLMLIKSLQLASMKEDLISSKLFEIISDAAVKIHEGQQMDVDFESMEEVSEKDYLKMIEYKTAILLSCSLQTGAYIANASFSNQKKMYDFGRYIGLAFQIKDDYLDVFGSEEVGKKIGGDILNNKKTLLYIASMRLGNKEQKISLKNYFSPSYLGTQTEKVLSVKKLFEETGAKQYCEDKLKEFYEKAIEKLKSVDASGSTKDLEDIANIMISRDK